MRPLDITKLTAEDIEEFKAQNPNFSGNFNMTTIESGPCYCGRTGGKIIGVGGVVIFWPGVGEAWSSYSPAALANHRREVFAYSKKFLEIAEQTHELWRIQAIINPKVSAAWPKHLGFEFEGTLKKYNTDGTDAHIWARVTK